MAIRKNSMSYKKTSTSGSSGGGLKVITDSKGKITGGSDSTGSFSVDSGGKATRTTGGGSSSGPTGISTPMGGATIGGTPAGVPNVTGVKTPVTTSDSARSTYDAMRDRIAKMANNTGNYSAVYNNPLYQETSGMIKDQRKSLADRKTAEIGRITADFGQRAEGQAQTQRSETGTQSMSLARIGGFDSASGQAVLTNLQRVHESEQNALMQARQSAILQAQQAYEDKDFALAKMQMDEAKATEAMLYNRQQDFLRNTLAINQEERAQNQFEYGRQRDQLQDQRQAAEFAFKHNIKTPFYFIGGVGYDTSTGEALTNEEYLARGGDPNYTANATVIEQGDELERQFVIDLANKYPDAPIDIQNDDIATARSRIAGSRIYQDQVRPPQGSSGDSKSALMATFLSSAKAVLDGQRNQVGEDGNKGEPYASPETYRDNKAAYISIGGTAADWFQMFPPEVYIAPQNRKGDLDIYKAKASMLEEDFAAALARIPVTSSDGN